MTELEIKDYGLQFTRELVTRDETKRIIIHHTGNTEEGDDSDSSAEQIHQLHINNKWAGIGYHIVIRRNGSLEQGRPIDTVGAHAEDNNPDSIGIHVCGSFMKSHKPTESELNILPKVIAALCDTYSIPFDRDHIIGHREVDSTDCPGDNLYPLLDSIVEQAKNFKGQYTLKGVKSSSSSSNNSSSGVPLYKQFDERWRDVSYGSNCMATSGCGPTCMAMILAWYGKSDTPDKVAEYFRSQNWDSGGTSHEAFTKGAKHWNIEMKQVSSVEEVKKALLDGFPVILLRRLKKQKLSNKTRLDERQLFLEK